MRGAGINFKIPSHDHHIRGGGSLLKPASAEAYVKSAIVKDAVDPTIRLGFNSFYICIRLESLSCI